MEDGGPREREGKERKRKRRVKTDRHDVRTNDHTYNTHITPCSFQFHILCSSFVCKLAPSINNINNDIPAHVNHTQHNYD